MSARTAADHLKAINDAPNVYAQMAYIGALVRQGETAARRDQFAAAALTGLASNGAGYLLAATEAVKYADALLVALDGTGHE